MLMEVAISARARHLSAWLSLWPLAIMTAAIDDVHIKMNARPPQSKQSI